MLINIVLLLIGFGLLIKGADIFVDGASGLAKKFHIPSVIIGLTIVSFGTSAPEASVSITAALSGSNDIALSNVIGSNIFNLAMVLGVSSIIATLPVTKSIVKKDFPFLLAITALMVIFCVTGNKISRIEGIIFLILIIGYIVYMIIQVKGRVIEHEENANPMPLWKSGLFIIGGIVGIMFGGDFVVNSAKSIALSFGLSEKLVGLTIVSVGTSLPELVTSLVAAKKGEVDIAVGNVVGSNIFNILFILGATATIATIGVDAALFVDLIIMASITVLVYLFAFKSYRITKAQGIILLCIFASYLTFIIIRN